MNKERAKEEQRMRKRDLGTLAVGMAYCCMGVGDPNGISPV